MSSLNIRVRLLAMKRTPRSQQSFWDHCYSFVT